MKSVIEKTSCKEATVSGTRLLLGVDGGGSKTRALLASVSAQDDMQVIGRGSGGPSNLRLAGKEQSLQSLDQAVDEALLDAGVPGQELDCAVLALAGSTAPGVQQDVYDWAMKRSLAKLVEIIPDVNPVLGRATESGAGIALIVGTGSVAVGTDSSGHSVTKGGWGHWFGDKGSGFYLGYKALAAVAEASDEIGPETVLSDLVLQELQTTDPRSILTEVTASGNTRCEVAALAPIVLRAAAAGDAVALDIANHAVSETVKLVEAVSKALEFDSPYPLALAGGVACRNVFFKDRLISKLELLQPPPASITVVDDPVQGCLAIAREALRGTGPAMHSSTN